MPVVNFVWDELSDNVLLETDEANVVSTKYSNFPHRFGSPISQEREGNLSYFHYDGNDSTRNLTDAAAKTTDTTIYSGYGEEVAKTGTTVNPFGYKGAAGYYLNPATDDLYVRARTYQPTQGRWLSNDPLGFIDGTNLYTATFVPNQTDPSGNATRNFKPKSVDEIARMPWRKRVLANAQGQTWPIDEKGLPNFSAYNIKCDCCKITEPRKQRSIGMRPGGCYRLLCTVNAYIQIQLDANDWGVFGEQPEMTIAQAYGHEQLHVAALLSMAETVAKMAEFWEPQLTGVTEQYCETWKDILEKVGNDAMADTLQMEMEHVGAVEREAYPRPLKGKYGTSQMGPRNDNAPGMLPPTNNCPVK